MVLGESNKRCVIRAMARFAAHAFEFGADKAQCRAISGAESKLEVEPPGSRSKPFLVASAELIRLDRKRRCAEHVMQDGQQAREHVRRFTAAERLEGVERKCDGAADTIDLDVADR